MELNVQEVVIRTEQTLERGWMQGSLHSADGSKHCIRGAFESAVQEVFFEQLSLAAPEEEPQILQVLARNYALRIEPIFTAHMRDFLAEAESRPCTAVETWNDRSGRKKEEVLAALRGFCEIIRTEESLREAEEVKFQEAVDAVGLLLPVVVG